MNKHKPRLALVSAAFVAALLHAPLVQAQTTGDEEDYVDYDAIVEELSRPAAPPASMRARAQRPSDPFEDVLIHGGVGFAGTVSTLRFPDGRRTHVSQRGFQAALGIDLFSKHWMAEGTARSFGEEHYRTASVALKEFDLKLFYRDRIAPKLGIKAGGGMSARYLTVSTDQGRRVYSTPSSVASLGLDMFISEGLSLGAELSARNTMIDETLDRSSFDATLRMDTHF